jgi:hypothetical protein
VDECPRDPEKSEPEVCGCGEAEILDDADDDGTADCADECPFDLNKNAAGVCGCGHPDTAVTGETVCETLVSALVHRYDFAGTGAVAEDRIGDADATVTNTTLSGGVIDLLGNDQYVDLPTSVLGGLGDATFEVWVTWDGGEPWQRIFDFGSNDAGIGAQGTGTSHLFLTPLSADVGGPPGLRVAFRGTDLVEVVVSVANALPTAVETVLAVVLDDANDELALFRDGQELARAALPDSLADLDVVNAWIGRS